MFISAIVIRCPLCRAVALLDMQNKKKNEAKTKTKTKPKPKPKPKPNTKYTEITKLMRVKNKRGQAPSSPETRAKINWDFEDRWLD